MIYHCCEENRRALVDAHPSLNGIDHLEVLDLDAPPGSPRQRTLLVRLLKPVPAGLSPDNLSVSGGERVRQVNVEWVGIASTPPAQASAAEQALFLALDEPDHVLVVRTDSDGDHSTIACACARPARWTPRWRTSTRACRRWTSPSKSNAPATSTASRSTTAPNRSLPPPTSTTWPATMPACAAW